ncbi:hypothetical protein CYMTET_31310 [Cymbomonas tetramitiformis]|uniref:GAF domain-containing protein n=1 Tax=Cymbomonas tetramitiformis TaxID=36881 RepID=A0AAE0FH79_9CHLO|nr:hypothetical protein CYMTET_31310 [Cymbomonas tetramitiformis]
MSAGAASWKYIPSGAESVLVLPLAGNAETGALLLLADRPRAFSPRERKWSAAMANKLANVMKHRKWAKAIRQHQLGDDYFGDATDVSKLAKVIVALKSELATAGLDTYVFNLR